MDGNILLKPVIPQPPTLLWDQQWVAFKHPGYQSPSNTLFRLPRLDTCYRSTPDPTEPRVSSDDELPVGSRQDSVVLGVHHRTALLACQVIANNAFGGYLATDREGQDRVDVGLDGMLSADTYWFHANRSGEDLNEVHGRDVYPIVPSFQDWAFPHQHFAVLGWESRPSMSTTIPTPAPLAPPPVLRPSIQRCILSKSTYSLEKAHIIPAAQRRWFIDNAMANYGRGSSTVDDESNKVYMRHDLHSVWDDHNFTIVPKGGDFVVHVLKLPHTGIEEFAAMWHNVPLQVHNDTLSHTAGEYLFAKFAQAVFMLLKPFIAQSPVHRFVARMQVQDDDPRHERKLNQEWVSGDSLNESYSGGGSNSASPSASRKRSRSQQSSNTGNRASHKTWYAQNVRSPSYASDSENTRESQWYQKNVRGDSTDSGDEYSEAERGRSRKRRRLRQSEQSEHTVDTLLSLTDMSVIGPDDVDRNLGLGGSSPPPLDEARKGQQKCPAGEELAKAICNSEII